jgi:predicted membrane channel-forming protein YqfA (hemolysin III family)
VTESRASKPEMKADQTISVFAFATLALMTVSAVVHRIDESLQAAMSKILGPEKLWQAINP